jgi:hypothetical protein
VLIIRNIGRFINPIVSPDKERGSIILGIKWTQTAEDGVRVQTFSRKIPLAVDQCENLDSIWEYFIDKTV